MEHENILSMAKRLGLPLHQDALERLEGFARLLHEENKTHNLTGLKTLQDIIAVLVLGSIIPFRGVNVPRGTRILDLGTGGGVPGLPLAVCFPGCEFMLIDSQRKKIDFVRRAASVLRLSNVKAECARAEDLAAEEGFRGGFDLVVSRAAGPLYVVLELAAPFVSIKGMLILYVKSEAQGLVGKTLFHASCLGLEAVSAENRIAEGLPADVLVLRKDRETPGKYPRRYAIVKREADMLEE